MVKCVYARMYHPSTELIDQIAVLLHIITLFDIWTAQQQSERKYWMKIILHLNILISMCVGTRKRARYSNKLQHILTDCPPLAYFFDVFKCEGYFDSLSLLDIIQWILLFVKYFNFHASNVTSTQFHANIININCVILFIYIK